MPESMLHKIKFETFYKSFKKTASSSPFTFSGMHSCPPSPVVRFTCMAFRCFPVLVRLHLLDSRHCSVSGHGWHQLGIKLIAICRRASSNCLPHRDFNGPMLGTDFCNLVICHWSIGKWNTILNYFQIFPGAIWTFWCHIVLPSNSPTELLFWQMPMASFIVPFLASFIGLFVGHCLPHGHAFADASSCKKSATSCHGWFIY